MCLKSWTMEGHLTLRGRIGFRLRFWFGCWIGCQFWCQVRCWIGCCIRCQIVTNRRQNQTTFLDAPVEYRFMQNHPQQSSTSSIVLLFVRTEKYKVPISKKYDYKRDRQILHSWEWGNPIKAKRNLEGHKQLWRSRTSLRRSTWWGSPASWSPRWKPSLKGGRISAVQRT